MLLRMSLLVLIALLAGCKTTSNFFPPSYTVLVYEDTLVYDGVIMGDAVLEAMRVVRQSGNTIKKLKITSPGGEIASGIEFGYFVKEYDLEVEVSGLCFSACANYILPAAKSVVINTNSLVGWHGGAKQSDEMWMLTVPSKHKEEFKSYISRLRVKETAFFGVMGVDQQITTYGQTIANSCQKGQKTDGWYYSIEDMRRMGIRNIEIKGSGLLSSMEYKQDSGQMDTTSFKGEKLTSCLLEDVFEAL